VNGKLRMTPEQISEAYNDFHTAACGPGHSGVSSASAGSGTGLNQPATSNTNAHPDEQARELREITCPLCKPSTHNPTPTICLCEKLRTWGDPPPNHQRLPHHHWSDGTGKEYVAHCTSKAEEIMPLLAKARLAEAEVLKTVLDALEPYVGHSFACSYGDNSPEGDYCTCELRWAQSIIREQRERIERLRHGCSLKDG